MKLRTLFPLLLLAALAAFAALNWSEFVRPTKLSLLLTTVQAPLGLIMLLLCALLLALFLVFVVVLQTSLIVDARRSARELRTQRELADQAEASRLTELRGVLETRLDSLEQKLSASIEQSGNTLAAYIGELEDRLARPPETRSPA